MTVEQRLMQALGELQFQNIVLAAQLEEARAKLAEGEVEAKPDGLTGEQKAD